MPKYITPIFPLGDIIGNQLFIKRDDFFPFSFGGNKARKAELFFREIDGKGYNAVVTYGSGSSNHCRVVANMCAARGVKCCIISPKEASENTFNRQMMQLLGAEITVAPVSNVHETIEDKLSELIECGFIPFFIPGGGHGNTGTQAYVDCYQEIKEYERSNNVFFDYIFLASGTGTTQAGLICGQLINQDERAVIGISIARKCPRGRNVVLESIREYMDAFRYQLSEDAAQKVTHFVDDYTGDGYGKQTIEVSDLIQEVMKTHGIPLDATYTGKAFYGMKDYLKKNNISGKSILFIHTGGTPLFFDYLKKEA